MIQNSLARSHDMYQIYLPLLRQVPISSKGACGGYLKLSTPTRNQSAHQLLISPHCASNQQKEDQHSQKRQSDFPPYTRLQLQLHIQIQLNPQPQPLLLLPHLTTLSLSLALGFPLLCRLGAVGEGMLPMIYQYREVRNAFVSGKGKG